MRETGLARHRRVAVAVLAAAFSVLLRAHQAQPAQVLYDDFNDPSHLVRADLWNRSPVFTTGGAGSGGTDSLSIIDALLFPTSNPKLLMAKRFVLQPGAASGSFDRDAYIMRQAPNAAGIQADVTMKLCSLSAPGFIGAYVIFAGFNDGTSPGPGNSTGDIHALFYVSCTSTNQAAIVWQVIRCTDVACNSSPLLGSGSFGAANIGQEYNLHVTKSGSSFVFTALGQTQTFPVPGNPAAPPRVLFNGPRTFISPTTPANGGEFTVAATFDNVFVDQ